VTPKLPSCRLTSPLPPPLPRDREWGRGEWRLTPHVVLDTDFSVPPQPPNDTPLPGGRGEQAKAPAATSCFCSIRDFPFSPPSFGPRPRSPSKNLIERPEGSAALRLPKSPGQPGCLCRSAFQLPTFRAASTENTHLLCSAHLFEKTQAWHNPWAPFIEKRHALSAGLTSHPADLICVPGSWFPD